MKKIAHIIQGGKFTLGYIRFMNIFMNHYNHIFFVVVLANENASAYEKERGVMCVGSYYFLMASRKKRKIIKSCDKVIVSGLWSPFCILGLGKNVLRKTYIQFWGGDFYCLREQLPIYSWRYYWNRLRLYTISQCAVAIFLLYTEYKRFKEITGLEKRHFIACMPADPTIEYEYAESPAITKKDLTRIRVLVGNSATKENQHIEAFHLLERWKDKIEILCPLSYGDGHYREQVLEEGRKIFGDAFIPLLEYMDQQTYIYHLATCDVGVFNNNRQQGMGNITILLFLKKKIYIRSDTSMWAQYKKDGFIMHDIDKLENMSYEDFIFHSQEEKEGNLAIEHQIFDPHLWAEEWIRIFEDDE